MRATDPQRKIVHRRDLRAETGLSPSQIEGLVGKGLFPPPARLSERRKGWFADEIAAWREQRRIERDLAIAAGAGIGTQFQGKVTAEPAK